VLEDGEATAGDEASRSKVAVGGGGVGGKGTQRLRGDAVRAGGVDTGPGAGLLLDARVSGGVRVVDQVDQPTSFAGFGHGMEGGALLLCGDPHGVQHRRWDGTVLVRHPVGVAVRDGREQLVGHPGGGDLT
jgi:hypothetical protein